jgi:hypothetical protein
VVEENIEVAGAAEEEAIENSTSMFKGFA